MSASKNLWGRWQRSYPAEVGRPFRDSLPPEVDPPFLKQMSKASFVSFSAHWTLPTLFSQPCYM